MTKVGILPSGVEIEYQKLTGKHQRLLTEKGSNSNEFIASFIVRLGSDTNITADKVQKMIAPDRKMALILARQYALNNNPIMRFNITYKTESGKKQIVPEELNLDELGGFPVTKPKMLVGDILVEADYKELSEIKKDFECILPESGMKVRWYMLDGLGEAWATKLAKNKRSSHTAIEMRFPVEIKKDSKGNDLPIKIDTAKLDNLSFIDIEYLREYIYEIEGRVDSEYMYSHPDTGEDQTIDLLTVTTFYFPSGKI